MKNIHVHGHCPAFECTLSEKRREEMDIQLLKSLSNLKLTGSTSEIITIVQQKKGRHLHGHGTLKKSQSSLLCLQQIKDTIIRQESSDMKHSG